MMLTHLEHHLLAEASGLRDGKEVVVAGDQIEQHLQLRANPQQRISGQTATRPLSTFEELGLHQNAIPTRSWKPGKVCIARDGIFPKNRKCLSKFAPFESSLEAIAHLHLSVDFRIKCYACQPHKLHYWMPNAEGGQDKHEYTPDFVALTKDGRLLIIDAKARRFATDEAWTKREPFIRASYQNEFGAELLVWTEHELKAEPRLSNARTLYRHRFEPHDKSVELDVRRSLIQHRECTIGRLCEELLQSDAHTPSDAYGAIMRLALTGELLLDERERYGRDTSVRFRSDAE